MKVKFENCEVDVWQLRKGVVLGFGTEFVHLAGIKSTTSGVRIIVNLWDGSIISYLSNHLEWLQPS